MNKNHTFRRLLAALCLTGCCLFLATPASARPGHGPGPGWHHGGWGGPAYHPRPYHYHHHHSGPSRGWYNGALAVGATLGILDLLTRPSTTYVAPTTTYVTPVPAQTTYVAPAQTTYVAPAQTTYVYQQPTTVVQPAPVTYVPATPVPVVQQTIWR